MNCEENEVKGALQLGRATKLVDGFMVPVFKFDFGSFANFSIQHLQLSKVTHH